MNATKGRNKKAEKPLECISSFHLIFLNKKETKQLRKKSIMHYWIRKGTKESRVGKRARILYYMSPFSEKNIS